MPEYKNKWNGKNNKIKYKYESSDKIFFINPYTFSEGSKTVNREEQEQEPESHTGVFVCRIYPKTPLLIPDVLEKEEIADRKEKNTKNKEIKHFSYPFFKVGDKPAIPGSSIRGPLRSIYEALTDSCYSTARSGQYITARTKSPFLPGLLVKKNGKWELHSATRYLLPIEDYRAREFDNGEIVKYSDVIDNYGERVYFKGELKYILNRRGNSIPQYRVLDTSEAKKRGYELGYYYIGEYINRKKYESIFKEDNLESDNSEVIEKCFEQLKEIQKKYMDEKINQKFVSSREPGNKDHHGGYKQVDLKKFEEANKAVLPIWYKKNKSNNKKVKYYFSLANIGRFRYETSMDEILGKQDDGRMPCYDVKKLCKACSLFGMVGDEEGFGSHIRITDAIFEGTISEKKNIYNLTELRTPHPSYLPFYADVNDYSLGYDATGCNIKGRKFYRHFIPDYEGLGKLDPKKIDSQMEGIEIDGESIGKDEVFFRFKVYFENLTQEQLDELATLLCLGENKKNGNLCFKLGHGKPLGFGSAKIVIESLEERIFNNCIADENEGTQEHYKYTKKIYSDLEKWNICKESGSEEGISKIQESIKSMRSILDITFFTNLDTNTKVAYPYVLDKRKDKSKNLAINELASSKWFSENLKLGGNRPEYILKQSSVDINEQKLPVIELKEDEDKK